MLWLLFFILFAIVGFIIWLHIQGEKEWRNELAQLRSAPSAEINKIQNSNMMDEANELAELEARLAKLKNIDTEQSEAKSAADLDSEEPIISQQSFSYEEDEEDAIEEPTIISSSLEHSNPVHHISSSYQSQEIQFENVEFNIQPSLQSTAESTFSEQIQSAFNNPSAVKTTNSLKKVEASEQSISLEIQEAFDEEQISAEKTQTFTLFDSADEIDTHTSKKPNPDADIITLDEATRHLDEPLERLNQPAPLTDVFEVEFHSDERPSEDLDIITLEEATRHHEPLNEDIVISNVEIQEQPAQPSEDLPIISLDDPSVIRTRERALAEVAKLTAEQPRNESKIQLIKTSAQQATINADDIRANLLRQRDARTRLPSNQNTTPTEPAIIPEEEVLANLGYPNRMVPHIRRRLNRISTAPKASVLPASAQIQEAHGSEIVRPKIDAPIIKSTRFAPIYADNAPPTATVVEAPVVPETPPLSVNIAQPASFSSSQPIENLNSASFAESVARRLQRSIDHSQEVAEHPFAIKDTADDQENIESETPIETSGFQWATFSSPSFETLDSTTTTAKIPAAQEIPNIQPLSSRENKSFGQEKSSKKSKNARKLSDGIALPSINLLTPPQSHPEAVQTREALLENSLTIEEKLAEFKVKVKVVDALAGPVITRYEIEPDTGVRGTAVINLEKDLARALGVASIRVVETIPGKTCMGLELPNPNRQTIQLSEILASEAFQESSSKLTLALGHDITGQPVVTDLGKAPHLLVAGTTGSGKSVAVNTMILSLLYKATPEEVRLIMIDPKMLELSVYEGIPHLLAPVVTDPRLAANALDWCVNEMERRYRLMSRLGVRNLISYNRKIEDAQAAGTPLENPFSLTPNHPEPLEKLPFIVVVVDEFADLMMTAGKKIEELITRLAQKARAAGIHLILATQRPSVDVITGLIKANIPTRIAFQVSSKVDSRTILDQMGAESLLGQGDMLFLPPGTGYPQRLHGAFTSDDEVYQVVEYLKQFGEPNYIDAILFGDDKENVSTNQGRQDALYDEAVACILKSQKASISSVQRTLHIDYNRAADLVAQMEANGVISAPDAHGKRTILKG